MKYRREILMIGFVLILFFYILGPMIEEKREVALEYLHKDIIRFHVRANSDRKEDQSLKLKVRDRILDLMDDRLKDVGSVEESRRIIQASAKDIKAISREVVEDNGYDYDINVSLKKEIFPIKKYGNLVFPQGEYESLTVEIGGAKGENWWCVMFPPLCFVDITHSVAVDSGDDSNLDEYIVDETQPFKLKSIILDWIRSRFN